MFNGHRVSVWEDRNSLKPKDAWGGALNSKLAIYLKDKIPYIFYHNNS